MLYPPDLEDCLKASGLSIEDLQEDRSIIYILDADLRIAFCNWAWDRFAFLNGGIGLTHLSVLGRPVLDVTPTPLRPFYKNAYAAARKTAQPWEHDFECSSHTDYRLFHMRVLPIGGGYLCVENSLRIERPHDADRAEPQAPLSTYLSDSGRVVICCNCRRTREVHSIGSPRWAWIPEFLASPPGEVTHALCGLCTRFFYREGSDLLPAEH